MSGSSDLGHLETEHWAQLQDMASRFEAAWKDADTVDLTSYLPAAGHPLRRVALHELIKTDLEARWRRGQIVGVEAYLEKFPELGNAALLSPALIYEEYRVRHLHGDKPPLAGYERRFPRQFAELQRLIREQPLPSMTPAAPEPPAEMKSLSSSVLRIGGGYKMIKRIGCGGFAEVWQAETPGGFPVAIKRILRPLDHAEAQLELRALGEIKQLSHPYLLQTRDYDLVDNRLYVVMDLADCTLSDRLQQCKQEGKIGIPVEELLRYIHESAEAIDYMHGEKVHHRDIKPKNILLHKGHAKVADFGLARMVASQRLTVTGSGTAPYMAPEVWRRQVSPHSDQYSLAVSYVELRIGRLPYAGTDMYSLMLDHLESKPNLDPMPEAEQRAVRKALSKEPAERYSNCTAFVQAVEEAVDAAPGESAIGYRRRKAADHRTSRQAPADMGTMVPGDTPTEPPTFMVNDARRATPAWKATRAPRGRSWALVGVLCAALVGLLAWKFLQPYLGEFQVEAPDPVTLKAGQTASVRVNVQRARFDGPISLSSTDGPHGVTLSGLIGPGADSTEATLRADADAELGDAVLTVRAEAEGRPPRDITLAVSVEPSYWKSTWRKADGADQEEDVNHRRHYTQIDVPLPDGTPVRCVLVAQRVGSGDGNIPTFYIMRDKVSNDLYGRFAAAKRTEAGKSWEKGGIFGDEVNGKDIGTKDGRLPALRMTVDQAHAFAVWLGGRLPSTMQWDKASGYYEKPRGRGPFRVPAGRKETENGCDWQPGEIAINRGKAGPMPVGTATCDLSPYGCRDMAGNGREWTRNLIGEPPRQVPLKKPQPTDSVYLRGRRYASLFPWLFQVVDDTDGMEADAYGIISPETGFRVVLDGF